MHLLLFDIDGTLVRVNGAGRRAVESALSDVVGTDLTTDGVQFSGKTDPQIVRDIFVANDVAATDDLVHEAVSVYAEVAVDALQPSDVTALPGAADLVDALSHHADVFLGLLTGNVRSMAHRKLDVVALADYFGFGAYGSDHADRNRLPEVALERARAHTGRTFTGSNTTIIGDTVRDIACGRFAGARCVGVATGSASRDELQEAGPDVLFDRLPDVDTFRHRVLA
jgi:phosphoglycolate phosphatase-like HAD superfamily hydrolase